MILSANAEQILMRHHGLVYADCETALPMQIQIEAEPAFVNGSRIVLGWKLDIRYAMTAIGGNEFLLPQTAEETVQFRALQTKVEIQFQQCRKYESSSTVTFGADGKP
jgi:hypothetical protein